MCMVSMVTGGMQQDYPKFPQGFGLGQLLDLSEILKRLDQLDKDLKAKNCDEPGKASFFEKLNARIEALERKQKKPRKKVAGFTVGQDH